MPARTAKSGHACGFGLEPHLRRAALYLAGAIAALGGVTDRVAGAHGAQCN